MFKSKASQESTDLKTKGPFSPIPILVVFLLSLSSLTASAAPQTYRIVPQESSINFFYDFSGVKSKGSFTDFKGIFSLNFSNAAQSKANVVINTQAINLPLAFALPALKSSQMLSVKKHPRARYHMTSVRQEGDTFLVEGRFNLKGIERSLSLRARFFRKKGLPANDLSQIVVHLNGAFDRSDYDVRGYEGLVGPTIWLDIRATLVRTK